MKIFHLAFKCILVLWSQFLGVRGLNSNFNIMRFVNKNMLVIENVDFSLMNEFMYKYMLPHKCYIAFKCFSFFHAVQL